jgi:hypothetical protein
MHIKVRRAGRWSLADARCGSISQPSPSAVSQGRESEPPVPVSSARSHAQYSRKNTEGQQCDFIYDLRIMIDAIKLRLPVKS